MKRYCLLLGILLLLAGCSVKESGEPAVTKRETLIPESQVEVENVQAFARVGADIDVPAGAENARYYIISDQIAEIQFSQNGAQYSYRASELTEDTADVQGETEEVEGVQAVAGSNVIPIQTTGSSFLAVWKWGTVTYSLMTEDQVEAGIMKALTEELARASMPVQI